MKETYPFPKKPLPYDFDALEPYIDRETMEYHHDKHLGTYTDKLNQALSGYPDYQGWTLEELLCNLEKLPEELRTPVIHNGGGVYNHWMYFSSLGREKKPMGETALKKVAESFGSLEQMMERNGGSSGRPVGLSGVHILSNLRMRESKRYRSAEC